MDRARVPDEDRVPLVRVQERDERVHDVSRDDHLIRRQAGLLGIGDGDVDPLNRVLDEIVEDLDRAGTAAADDDALAGREQLLADERDQVLRRLRQLLEQRCLQCGVRWPRTHRIRDVRCRRAPATSKRDPRDSSDDEDADDDGEDNAG